MKNEYCIDEHFGEQLSNEVIKNMWYEDEEGIRHYAPYFSDSEIRSIFEEVMDDISDYTIYDLAVTMNQLRSDHNRTIGRCCKDGKELAEMVKLMAVEFLQDLYCRYPDSKTWHIING